jgi:hypothetical protein
MDLNSYVGQFDSYKNQIKDYGRQAKSKLDDYIGKYLNKYKKGVYLNDISLDWVKISENQKGSLKEYPLDPSSVPDQIQTNLRIGNQEFSLDIMFNFNNKEKKELYQKIKELFRKKEQVKIITKDEIFENLLITGISRDVNSDNYSFKLNIVQYQTARIVSTGEVAGSEATQVNQTTTVGTQGVTSSNVSGGYLK